jgi:NAD(P)-dependent dehydrogenase (short-subunit alcohol dehydrogenase family)
MELGLKNKRAFISGSTSGIGYETAKLFAMEGAEVIINGRSKQHVSMAVERLRSYDTNLIVKGIVADLGTAAGVKKALKQVQDVDILVNNLGIYTSSSFEGTSDDDWLRLFEVNILSGVRLTRALLPSMIKKDFGRIIFVSSECAELVPSDLIAYSTTKAALHALSKGLAQTCRGSNVTVNTVMPGSTMTEGAEIFIQNLAKQEGKTFGQTEKDFISENRRNSTLQRFLTPFEVAQGIVYLASPIASATNGAILKLDGGSTGGY